MRAVKRRCVSCGKSFQRTQPKDRRKHCRDSRPSQTAKMMGGKPLPRHRNFERSSSLRAETAVKRPKGSLRYLRTRDGEIVPDAKWPGMYRIKWRDGRLSDMVNYTRASAALSIAAV
jgi:hypothetical protein